ncbi:MAG: hypothetical protein GY717_01590, partial [Rhodobacteraceae bacterium]|nr:hypothetical protein [Paracoccaceae bacterium]
MQRFRRGDTKMATVLLDTTHFVALANFTTNDAFASWTDVNITAFESEVVDRDGDLKLDSLGSTPDYWLNPAIQYTGWVVNIIGNNYGIFMGTSHGETTAYVPYDEAFDNLAKTANWPSITYQRILDDAITSNCFAAGTGIATPAGETAVEELQIGDTILTADGRAVAVKWIGHQTERPVIGLMNQRLEPVRICAGALGQGLPLAD